MTSIAQHWNSSIVPIFVEYIDIPSQYFDKNWANNGHIEHAVTLPAERCRKHAVEGMQLEILRLTWQTSVRI